MVSDNGPVEVNKMGAPMGASFKRPIGCKASKKLEKEERSLASTQLNNAAVMKNLFKTQASMTEACERIAAALDKKNALNLHLRTNEMKMHMVKMYKEFGDMDKAKEILESIKISTKPPNVQEEVL